MKRKQNMGLGEFDEFTLSYVPENRYLNAEGEISGTLNASMIEHIMKGYDDFEVKEIKKMNLNITIKK